MRLSEIKVFERDTEADFRPFHGTSDFTIKGFDGLQPDGSYYDDMDVVVEFHKDKDYRDERGSASVTGLFLAADVKQYDSKTDEVIKTWPKDHDVQKMPGFEKSDLDWFQMKLEDHLS